MSENRGEKKPKLTYSYCLSPKPKDSLFILIQDLENQQIFTFKSGNQWLFAIFALKMTLTFNQLLKYSQFNCKYI